MKIHGGATLWARQTIESRIFSEKPDKWFKIWFFLVNKVSHQDNDRSKRGTCFTKYEWIKESTGATYNQIKHCVEYLKATSMLATQKGTRGFTVTVCNYDKFQSLGNYKSHTERKTKGIQKENKSHTISTIKNDKNDKNDNIKKINKENLIVENFNEIWNKYPNKDGSKSAFSHFKQSVKTPEDFENIQKALKNYLSSRKVKEGFVKNGSTWFNNWKDWINFEEPEVKKDIIVFSTEESKIVKAYKESKGFDKVEGWDELNFKIIRKDVQALLFLNNKNQKDIKFLTGAIKSIARYLEEERLSWTLNTVVKQFPEYLREQMEG